MIQTLVDTCLTPTIQALLEIAFLALLVRERARAPKERTDEREEEVDEEARQLQSGLGGRTRVAHAAELAW